MPPLPPHDKRLFTPGPLTTSRTVKEAMLHDLGSRDAAFIETIRAIRHDLLALAGLSPEHGYEAILMQGSGTFGLEAVVGSVIPPDGRLLVLVNGAYGTRIAKMAEVLGMATLTLAVPEDQTPDPEAVEAVLADHPDVTHVFVVHCETTTGILNPIQAIGERVKAHGAVYGVDAMSSFGAIPIDLPACGIDFLVTSANKCIEGVPGFAVILARRETLLATEGYARSLSLNLLDQWRGLEANGQFRFTPPTHALLAFHQALKELQDEGGVPGRAARYRTNHYTLVAGLRALGLRPFLDPARQSYIITSFHYPKDPRFDFDTFYRRLSDRGLVIYPGKVSQANLFRIGHIGRLTPTDMQDLVDAVEEVLVEMGVSVPLGG